MEAHCWIAHWIKHFALFHAHFASSWRACFFKTLIWGQFCLNQKQIKAGFLPCLKADREWWAQSGSCLPALPGQGSSRGHLLPSLISLLLGLPLHKPTTPHLSLRPPKSPLFIAAPAPSPSSLQCQTWQVAQNRTETHHLANFLLCLGQVMLGLSYLIPRTAGEN